MSNLAQFTDQETEALECAQCCQMAEEAVAMASLVWVLGSSEKEPGPKLPSDLVPW